MSAIDRRSSSNGKPKGAALEERTRHDPPKAVPQTWAEWGHPDKHGMMVTRGELMAYGNFLARNMGTFMRQNAWYRRWWRLALAWARFLVTPRRDGGA